MLNPAPADIQLDYQALNLALDQSKSGIFMGTSAAFFGPLMCTLDFSWTLDPAIETAATDGSRFWWNVGDFIRCRNDNKGEDRTTIMHELWHVARLHPLRRGTRCPDVWNKACDILINRELKKAGYYIGADWLLRPDLDHLEVEEDIYDALQKPGGGGGSSQGTHKCSNAQVSLNPQQAQKMVNAAVKAIQQAKMSNAAGSIPGNTEHIVNKFLAPKIPWETHLYRWMQDLMDEDYTWRRPNRRYEDMYLPSRFTDDGRLQHLIYYWDVSGSIGDAEELRFNSELKYIWEQFKPKKITIAQFDTQITKVDEWTEGMAFNEVKIVGKGGTHLGPVRQHIMDNNPTAAIIFSDLYCAPMVPGPTCPIIWVAVGNTSAQVPFGKLIHIEA